MMEDNIIKFSIFGYIIFLVFIGNQVNFYHGKIEMKKNNSDIPTYATTGGIYNNLMPIFDLEIEKDAEIEQWRISKNRYLALFWILLSSTFIVITIVLIVQN